MIVAERITYSLQMERTLLGAHWRRKSVDPVGAAGLAKEHSRWGSSFVSMRAGRRPRDENPYVFTSGFRRNLHECRGFTGGDVIRQYVADACTVELVLQDGGFQG